MIEVVLVGNVVVGMVEMVVEIVVKMEIMMKMVVSVVVVLEVLVVEAKVFLWVLEVLVMGGGCGSGGGSNDGWDGG